MESVSSEKPPAAAVTPIQQLKGVGPKLAQRLEKLAIHSVEDLLFHLPLRYEDRTRITPIGALRPASEAVIQGSVELTEIKFGRRRMLLSRISDGTGFLTLRFFHFNARQQELLRRGNTVRCFGEARRGSGGLEMIHPEFARLDEDLSREVEEALTPVYPATDGVHQLTLRNLTDQALLWLQQDRLSLQDDLSPLQVGNESLPDLKQALLYLHRPPPDASLAVLREGQHIMQQRLIFEELLAHVLSLRQLRARARQHRAVALKTGGKLTRQFVDGLGFELTGAQQRVAAVIEQDLQKPLPMQRLVQGDVGSGKTVVAALAALQAVEAGYQAAIMAPTEILAEQHYLNFSHWLAPLGIRVSLLSGRQKTAVRKQAMQDLEDGTTRVAVGTHALFQDDIRFNRLALVVIDEQHRFGVHQRMALWGKGRQGDQYPHQLIMTATPIPRTLSMAVYADLDCSIIDELPPGRKPVETVVIPDSRRAEVVERVARACQQGKQVYWVCTLIEESDALQCQAAEDTARLLAEALPEINVGLVHGRMKSGDKQNVMQDFKAGNIELLVATTVIEVGVDVPNASLMIMENAERLGLSQLHQLRGRVGRGSEASVCVLMYQGKLSQQARERLAAMRDSNDGFVIARKDLELRGPGEVLGTKQTGQLQLRIADLQRDQHLMPEVLACADRLLLQDRPLADKLIQRWVGEATRYGHV